MQIISWPVLAVVLWGCCSGWAMAAPPLGQGYDFPGNGKRPGARQVEVWKPEKDGAAIMASGWRQQTGSPGVVSGSVHPQTFISDAKRAAQVNLEAAANYPAGGKISCGNLTVTANRWNRTAQIVAEALAAGRDVPSQEIRLYRCRGEDDQGNVHFTGYFTPLLKARRNPDKRFRYPLYRLPKVKSSSWPTREEIDQHGALASQGLELAWTDDLLELYFLHVQGSGQLAFPDGTVEGVGVAGSNRHQYQSLGRYLVKRGSIAPEAISLWSIRQWMADHPEELVPLLNLNPSYTFFQKTPCLTRGSAKVELISGHSVAADRTYLPLGACLLAEVPQLDKTGRCYGYTPTLLFVHDTGGAIQGPGHLDLYHGIGREAGDTAGNLHHYGRIWLLLADEAPE